MDSNVILDVVTDDPVWKEWSLRQLNRLSSVEALAINDVVFAEVSPGFDRFEDVDRLVDEMGLVVLPFSREALYLAGHAHHRYRRADGIKEGVLPDFFIGAQAAVGGLPLLTRDIRRFRTYFPTVELITP